MSCCQRLLNMIHNKFRGRMHRLVVKMRPWSTLHGMRIVSILSADDHGPHVVYVVTSIMNGNIDDLRSLSYD